MTHADYNQTSGLFRVWNSDGHLAYSVVGYAGRGEGKNQPTAQDRAGVVPLPTGVYLVGAPFAHPRLGPVAFRLTPVPSNAMYGRSAFLIHGDSKERPGQASSGCIVLGRTAGDVVKRLACRFVVVHTGRP